MQIGNQNAWWEFKQYILKVDKKKSDFLGKLEPGTLHGWFLTKQYADNTVI